MYTHAFYVPFSTPTPSLTPQQKPESQISKPSALTVQIEKFRIKNWGSHSHFSVKVKLFHFLSGSQSASFSLLGKHFTSLFQKHLSM
jgi:hypothetical protein